METISNLIDKFEDEYAELFKDDLIKMATTPEKFKLSFDLLGEKKKTKVLLHNEYIEVLQKTYKHFVKKEIFELETGILIKELEAAKIKLRALQKDIK